MHTDIKICGLSTEQAVTSAIDAGAEMIGFIFFEKSPRHLDIEAAAQLAQLAGNRVAKVAVTVNADDGYLDEIVASVRPDFLQLHGNESPQRVTELKKRHGLRVIKAFAIRQAADFDKLEPYEGIADKFLLDAKAPEGSVLPGGNGVSFDWRLLGQLHTPTPYLLSGGLDELNIATALEISGAKSIDVSSGVESAPGVKDIAKIATFIKTVRARDLSQGNSGTRPESIPKAG